MSDDSAVITEDDSEPVEGADAGPAEKYHNDWLLEQVSSAHSLASELLQAARDACAASLEDAEMLAREALTAAAHAYWWAEGTAGASTEHKFLHHLS